MEDKIVEDCTTGVLPCCARDKHSTRLCRECFRSRSKVFSKHLFRLKPFNIIREIYGWLIDYSGYGAELVKALPVALMALFILHPMIIYPFLLAHTEPFCYIIFAVTLTYTAFIFYVGVKIAYLREQKG